MNSLTDSITMIRRNLFWSCYYFYNIGAKFDENGKENNWWTNNDHKMFETRAQCFEKEYNE